MGVHPRLGIARAIPFINVTAAVSEQQSQVISHHVSIEGELLMKICHEVQFASQITRSAMLLAALTAGMWSVAASAGDHKDHDAQTMSNEPFERHDADGDGRLTRDEYRNMTLEPGAGSAEEAAGQGMPATEHQAEAMRGFDDLDSDGDGHISSDELSDAETTGASSGVSKPSASTQ